jgi:arginine N-succinyltransferase
MYLIREVQETDLDDLFELSELVFFINLPRDRDLIEKKILNSIKSFKSPSKDKSRNNFLFVMEDSTTNKVIGVSLIHGQHGTEDEPHYFLRVGQEQKFSESLSTGFIHGTLTFDYEPNGWSEIGGLVVHPDYRANGQKLGKQLSFCRFVYIGLHRQLFTQEIHTELMPPLDQHGNSPLWEAIGRRFMNMDYQEADILSRKNKDFIFNLWPSGIIYTTLLSVEARDSIGKVGEDTRPVKKMLEEIGFKYVREVDPFDGGPHYRAKVDEIKPVRELKSITFKSSSEIKNRHQYLITLPGSTFSMTRVEGEIRGNTLYSDTDLALVCNLKEFKTDIITI